MLFHKMMRYFCPIADKVCFVCRQRLLWSSISSFILTLRVPRHVRHIRAKHRSWRTQHYGHRHQNSGDRGLSLLLDLLGKTSDCGCILYIYHYSVQVIFHIINYPAQFSEFFVCNTLHICII